MVSEPTKREPPGNDETVVPGNELIERVRKLVAEGNVRRLIIKKPGGEVMLEIPLTAGMVAGGAAILMAPVLAALGALAALLSEVSLEVVRTEPKERDEDR